MRKGLYTLKQYPITQYCVGLIVSLLGLTVLIGWYSHTRILIQVLPQFVPMQYNTALGFLLSGVGILSTKYYPRLSQILGFIILLIGTLTLMEYLFFVNLGIDELFMRHYITIETSHPGRMAPNTATCFLLTGICLFLHNLSHSKKRLFRVFAFFLGALICLLSLSALFGYITQINTAYGWGQLTRMAVHTALGFLLISIYFMPTLWNESQLSKFYEGIFLPYLVLIFGSLLFLILGYAILNFLHSSAKDELNKQSETLSSQISIELNMHLKSLNRLFDRLHDASYSSLMAWQRDAKNYIRDIHSITAITILQPHSNIQPIIMKKNNISEESVEYLNHHCEKLFHLEKGHSKSNFLLTKGKQNQYYLCVHDQQSDVIALINIKKFVDGMFLTQFATENYITVRNNNEIIYHNKVFPQDYKPKFTAISPLNLQNNKWELKISPHPQFLDNYMSSIPLMFVLIGAFTTCLLSITLRYWQIAKLKQRQLQDNAARITYLAYHDPLTGLLNRTQYERKIELAIDKAKRLNRYMAILFLDLDRFKHINDSYGHDFGDSFLIKISQILQKTVHDGDAVCRIGGDEFGIVLSELSLPEDAGIAANKIIEAFKDGIQEDAKHVGVTTSIGIATYPKAGTDRLTLTKHADIALYHAKGSGKNTFRFFSDELDTIVKNRFKIESLLFSAFINKEFYLVYQPIVDVKTKKIVGFETLIRWQSPTLGLVRPDDFIPIAEETHLIIDIGRWVFEEALRTFSHYYKKDPNLKLNVNLSPQQINNDNWFDYAKNLVNTFSISPTSIVFELTETAIITDLQNMKDKLNQLVDYGFNIYIDDFGTGYSSLQLIRELPVTGLKIDKCFVSDLNQTDAEGKMIRSIISLASLHDLSLIAEGVEHQSEHEFIALHQCQYAQGFYFSKPVTAKKIKLKL